MYLVFVHIFDGLSNTSVAVNFNSPPHPHTSNSKLMMLDNPVGTRPVGLPNDNYSTNYILILKYPNSKNYSKIKLVTL